MDWLRILKSYTWERSLYDHHIYLGQAEEPFADEMMTIDVSGSPVGITIKISKQADPSDCHLVYATVYISGIHYDVSTITNFLRSK